MRRAYGSVFAVLVALLVVLGGFPVASSAEAVVYDVSTSAELAEAVAAVNSAGAGEYVINLLQDVSAAGVDFTVAGVSVTIVGNGHALTKTGSGSLIQAWNGATVNVGDGVSSLTLSGSGERAEAALVYVHGGESVLNLYDRVTIKDHQANNYLGGGVSVDGGTFHMYGGSIENCGIEGGSVCYGGGVAVYSGGLFVMDDGAIRDCYAHSDYVDAYDPNRCFAAVGGGVFVSAGASFTMNGGVIENCDATNFGGGVAEIASYFEISSGLGYHKNTVVINDGQIRGNTAENGAGIFHSAYFYAYFSTIGSSAPGVGTTSNPGLYVNGGTISGNTANDSGGGVFVAMVRPTIKMQLHNAEISGNRADTGAGVEVYGYWTQTDIDGCTITGNVAAANGGGVALQSNSSGGETTLKNTTIENNVSGDRGAGVYYDANSKLTISGADVIRNNLFNGEQNNLNVYSTAKPVYVGGALTGSEIGLSDPVLWDDALANEDPAAVSGEALTGGYKSGNGEDPSGFFTSDHPTWSVAFSDVNSDEVRLVRLPYEYVTTIDVTKSYETMTGYDGAGTALDPAGVFTEDVSFVIEPYASYNREVGKTDIPAFSEASYTISAGTGSDQTTVTLPDFTAAEYGIGNYWYKVTETAGSTAGVTYDDNEYYLHLVVTMEDLVTGNCGVSQAALHKSAPAADGSFTNDTDDKVTGFTNQYGAGSLSVSKRVTGNMGDKNKTFEVNVVLTAPAGKTVMSPITYGTQTIDANWTSEKTVTLTLRDGDEVHFDNVPDGVTYTVAEADYSDDGYDVPEYAFDDASETGDTVQTGAAWADAYASGTISDSADALTVTNNKTAEIDVCVILENAPFVLLFVLAAGTIAAILLKRRKTAA